MNAPADTAIRQLAAINRIAQIALQDLTLRPMLQRIVDALHEEFGWDFIACAGIDLNRGEFVCEAVRSTLPTDVVVGYRRPLGSGVVGSCALSAETIDIDDTRGHPNFIDTLGGTLSELCVPVIHDHRVVAILNVESRQLAAFRGQRELLETVAAQIAGVIHAAQLLEQLNAAHRELQAAYRVMASHAQVDGLTGIANRRCFDAWIGDACTEAFRLEQPLSLLLIDIDHFKPYNDHYGHLAGDECLRQVAQLLASHGGSTMIQAARYGGEEFTLILRRADLDAARAHAEQLRAAVAALALPHAGSPLTRISLSIGVASLRLDQADSPSALIARADVQLYAAKRGGRDRVCAEA
jgi:diguanylate cyclase (GGDEF)-like protein